MAFPLIPIVVASGIAALVTYLGVRMAKDEKREHSHDDAKDFDETAHKGEDARDASYKARQRGRERDHPSPRSTRPMPPDPRPQLRDDVKNQIINPRRVKPFARPGRAAHGSNPFINITKIPGRGDTVKDAKGKTRTLVNELGRGGEGKSYETDDHLVCKIYHSNRLKQSTIDKIKLMTSREVRHPALCWPISLVCNSHNETVGYLMPRASGRELQRVVFIPPLFQKTFPCWTRLHLVKITSTILDAVNYLHSLNVLLGDINARNILVKSEFRVFFVDCDSYQVEDFSCSMAMPPYLAPELHNKDLKFTLRTLEQEYFAIATLVFMLLHPGKPPYSHRGGEDPSKNVRKQHFPYPLGDRPGSRVPAGQWGFSWSHLPRYMKEAFHQVFGPETRSSDRLSVDDWQNLLRRYQHDLEKGYVSQEIFPKGPKLLTKTQAEKHSIPWQDCDSCGLGFAKFDDQTTCPNCI